MTDVATPHLTVEERRELVQRTAKRFYARKVLYSRLFIALCVLGLVLAFIPLTSIVYNVIKKGLPYISWSFLTTPQKLPDIFHQNDIGGISNAITGTIVVFGIGLLIAIPVSMLLAVALYESTSKSVHALRIYLEVMIGLPSILFGLFIYAYVVKPQGYHLSGYAGGLALALLMLPLMTIACERALNDVPATLKEAALALGARPSRVMRRVLLPYALPQMWTGIMLSLSRAVGETAPVLFVIGTALSTSWNPNDEQATLPTAIFGNLSSTYSTLHEECWGIALVLIVAVFSLNLVSKLIVTRTNKTRGI
jgi:phosphate transport system permease protein